MQETDATRKLCHMKLARPNAGDNVNLECHGSECMAWDVWMEPVCDPETKRIIGHKPLDPPQGDCGLKPPELNCDYR